MVEAERRGGIAEAESEAIHDPLINKAFVLPLQQLLRSPKANWDQFKLALLRSAQDMWPTPNPDEPETFDPTAADLYYWQTPAWNGIVDMLRQCEFIPEDEVSKKAMILARYEPNLDPNNFKLVAELRRVATNSVLSQNKASWSFTWLHSLCRKYLEILEQQEGNLHYFQERNSVLKVCLDRTKDFNALWDLARTVAGTRAFPSRPSKMARLTIHEVRLEVERLMNWCAMELESTPDVEATFNPPSKYAPTSPEPLSTRENAGQLKRKRFTQEQAEIFVRDWLMKNAAEDPDGVRRDAIAMSTGVSAGSVSKTAAWRAFLERRRAIAKPDVRAVPLTDSMQALIPNGKNLSGELEDTIREQAEEMADDERRHKRRHRPS